MFAVSDTDCCPPAVELWFPEQPPPRHQGHASDCRGWRAYPGGAAEQGMCGSYVDTNTLNIVIYIIIGLHLIVIIGKVLFDMNSAKGLIILLIISVSSTAIVYGCQSLSPRFLPEYLPTFTVIIRSMILTGQGYFREPLTSGVV